MTRHFLDLDATTLPTSSLELAQRNIHYLVNTRAMGLFFGEAGLGKTFAVHDALLAHQRLAHWFTFPLNTMPRALIGSLLHLLTGVPHTGTQSRLEPRLIDTLSETPRVVVVDEAQHLNYPCVEYLRHLHDHPATQFALVLVGGNGCYELIQRYPMLRSRIARWTKFFPLTTQEVIELLPRFHRLYRESDPVLIEQVDARFACGNLRNWANFTSTAIDLAARANSDRLTHAIIEAALYLLGAEQDAA